MKQKTLSEKIEINGEFLREPYKVIPARDVEQHIQRAKERLLSLFKGGCGKEYLEYFGPENQPHTIDDEDEVMCGRTMANGYFPLCEDCKESIEQINKIFKEEFGNYDDGNTN